MPEAEGPAPVGADGDGSASSARRARIGAAAAVGSAAAGFGAVAVALSMSPWFSWSDDALSDLGHPMHTSAAIFGAGVAASGLLYVAFVWGLSGATPRTELGTAALLLLAAGGLSLAAIGVVNESYGAPHFVLSLTYFTFVPLGMVLLAAAKRSTCPRFAVATMASGVAAAAFGTSILTAISSKAPFTSQAVPELIASVILALWSCATGLLLLQGRLGLPTR